MRIVIIEDLEYEKFEKIRDILMNPKSGVPYGLCSTQYSKVLKTGYFQFWDEFYIPDALKKYINRPPGKSKMKELSSNIAEILSKKLTTLNRKTIQFEGETKWK